MEKSPHSSSINSARDLARFIDHTLLAPHAGEAQFEKLCSEALTWNTASVCVPSSWVSYCVEKLKDSTVAVCSVIGFPHGNAVSGAKFEEAKIVLASGAREIDVVMNYGALLNGDFDCVRREILTLAALCHEGATKGALLKVILESGALREHGGARGEQHIIDACEICSEVNADFVKTGTGFYRKKNGDLAVATLEDVTLMAQRVPPRVKVKAAGGH